MTTIEVVDRFSVAELRAHPDTLYIFGDNLAERGMRGQAVIRGQLNAMGIPTKKAPSMRDSAFFDDIQLEFNVLRIEEAIVQIERRVANDENIKRVVFPADGLGTGLAQLATRAPKTAAELDRLVGEFAERIQPGSSARLTKTSNGPVVSNGCVEK